MGRHKTVKISKPTVQQNDIQALINRQTGGEASKVGTPTPPKIHCNSTFAPSAPTNLTAIPLDGGVRLCWGPPSNGGCVAEYKVAYRLVPLTDEESKQVRWLYKTTTNYGCAALTDLRDRRSYQIAVQASTGGRGGYAMVEATVAKTWRCMPVVNYYPICRKAQAGGCNPMSCAEQAKTSMCSAPWLRSYDFSSKTMVQYCSDFCGCSVEAPGSAAEMALKSNNQQYDSYGGCCKA